VRPCHSPVVKIVILEHNLLGSETLAQLGFQEIGTADVGQRLCERFSSAITPQVPVHVFALCERIGLAGLYLTYVIFCQLPYSHKLKLQVNP